MRKIILALSCLMLWSLPAFALTLGDTDGGASCDGGSGAVAVTYVLSGDATVTAIHVNSNGTSSNNYQGGIWSDNATVPNTLLAGGAAAALVDGVNCNNVSYVESSVSSVSVSAQTLWIGGVVNVAGTSSALEVTFDTGNNGYDATVGQDPIANWPTASDTARAGRQYSAYFTYTAAGGAARRVIMVN